MNTVIVHYDHRGEVTYLVNGEAVRFFIVDERAPNDRVYEWLTRDDEAAINDVLKDDPVGSSDDERHKAISHRINAILDGKPFLEPVK